MQGWESGWVFYSSPSSSQTLPTVEWDSLLPLPWGQVAFPIKVWSDSRYGQVAFLPSLAYVFASYQRGDRGVGMSVRFLVYDSVAVAQYFMHMQVLEGTQISFSGYFCSAFKCWQALHGSITNSISELTPDVTSACEYWGMFTEKLAKWLQTCLCMPFPGVININSDAHTYFKNLGIH